MRKIFAFIALILSSQAIAITIEDPNNYLNDEKLISIDNQHLRTLDRYYKSILGKGLTHEERGLQEDKISGYWTLYKLLAKIIHSIDGVESYYLIGEYEPEESFIDLFNIFKQDGFSDKERSNANKLIKEAKSHLAIINEELIKLQRDNDFTSNYHINIENIKIIGFFDEITKKNLDIED